MFRVRSCPEPLSAPSTSWYPHNTSSRSGCLRDFPDLPRYSPRLIAHEPCTIWILNIRGGTVSRGGFPCNPPQGLLHGTKAVVSRAGTKPRMGASWAGICRARETASGKKKTRTMSYQVGKCSGAVDSLSEKPVAAPREQRGATQPFPIGWRDGFERPNPPSRVVRLNLIARRSSRVFPSPG